MTTEKIVSQNYTADQTAQAVEAYAAGQTVEAIAIQLGKSVRSVVAKLSREKVYVAKTKVAAARVTKAVLISMIAAKYNIDTAVLSTLEKANHEALEALASAV